MRQEHLHMPSDEDGLMLHGLLQLPQGEVRGILHLVHGMCDHKERYQQMLDFFSEQGFMQTGWVKLDDGWRYFAEAGKMVTGRASVTAMIWDTFMMPAASGSCGTSIRSSIG